MRKRSGLWKHLDALGILETGSPDEIAAAKRGYWKTYHYNHRRQQLKENPEVIVAFSRADGTYERIAAGARKHKMTLAAFIRASAVAYLTETYIVPDRAFLAHLEQLLAQCANEIQALAGVREKYFWQRDQKIESIEARIILLETSVREHLSSPPKLEQLLCDALNQSLDIKAHLLQLITSHDRQDKIKEK